jgi:Periplasmic binding protein
MFGDKEIVGRRANASLSPKVQKRKSGRDAMRLVAGFGALGVMAPAAWPLAAAEMRGVTATEIRIGQTMPYSAPVSAFGALGKGEVGYFKMLNERGGINGRKINLISLDDGYAAEGGGADQAPGRKRRGRADLFHHRHGAEHGDREISAGQERPAIVRRLRCIEIRRHRAISASDRRRAGAVSL